MKSATVRNWVIVAGLAGLTLLIWCEALERAVSLYAG